MDFKSIVEEIKFKVTSGVLACELDDNQIGTIVNVSFRELQRYYDDTTLVTIPYSRCMDMSNYNIASVSRVFRAHGFMADDGSTVSSAPVDPMYLSQWQIFSGPGGLYNVNDFALDFASYNTMLQIKNTISTDLQFRYERYNKKLYVSCPYDKPAKITVEYIPLLTNVEEIKSDYWVDILIQLGVAYTKIALGRMRSRFKLSNVLWEQDGETLLTEGTTELKELRDKLDANSNVVYPID